MSNDSVEAVPSLQAQLQPSAARLGDVLTLQVQATHLAGSAFEPPAIPKELGTFEVVSSTALPAEATGPLETQRFQLQLQNFTTGQQLLPAIPFTYRDNQNKTRILKTPEFKVAIELVPAGPKDKGDIRGIKGVLGPVALSPWWWLLLVFAAVLVGAALWKKRQRTVEGPPPPPPVPADTKALSRLQELRASGWVEAGKIKEFYSVVSEVVRTYLEEGFACPALERTTNELMRDIRTRSRFTSEQLIVLKSLLEDCDLVKFAKFRPDPAEALKSHASAVQFVESTRALLKTSAPAEEGGKK